MILSKEIKNEISYLFDGLKAIESGEQDAFLLLNESLGPLLTELAFIASDNELFKRFEIQKNLENYLNAVGPTGGLPKPWIDGEDLIHIGYSPSAEIKQLLKIIYLKQLHHDFKSPLEAKL